MLRSQLIILTMIALLIEAALLYSLVSSNLPAFAQRLRELLARIFHADRDEEAAKAGTQASSKNNFSVKKTCFSFVMSITQHPSLFSDSSVDQHEISGLDP